VLALAGASWITAAESDGTPPDGRYAPTPLGDWTLDGPDAELQRLEMLSRAQLELTPEVAERFAAEAFEPIRGALAPPLPACRLLDAPPSGTSPKFDCVFDGGGVVKVKYGRNPEIHAEAAATTLMRRLGYPTDVVTIVPRLRCYGCPRYPFLAARLQAAFAFPLLPADGYTEFEWVAVERKFPAPAIETAGRKGWAWWELERSRAPRATLDRLRLTAVFLAHWDNKSDNQRLICLDAPSAMPAEPCARPVAMIQDLGATLGPSKVNLARWRHLPIWEDRAACTVNMRALPFEGGTFPATPISEEGRTQLVRGLRDITDAELARLFSDARFPDFQVGTEDDGDLKAWIAAFRERVDRIAEGGPCPAAADLADQGGLDTE